MPEYSSTTITPSDGVQVPGMNGSTSGNFLLSALKSYILSEKGLANGLASLDGNGKLLSSQLPDLADDVIVVASYATLPATGTAGKLYITADNNKMYRWDPDLTTPDYVELSVDLSAYATKAELAAEESARESEDSNLKSAIDNNSQRIENLEVAVSGSLVQTNTDATMANTKTITNANEILPWAILKRVGARAVAWNQLIQTREGIPHANQYYPMFIEQVLNIVNGHKYLFSALVPAGCNVYRQNQTGLSVGSYYYTVTNDTRIDFIATATETRTMTATQVSAVISKTSTTEQGYKLDNCMVFDLTLMDEYDSNLTDAQNIANFRAKYPASYYAPNTGSIIPLNPSGFKVVGKNKIDESTMIRKDYYGATNQYWIRWTNLISYSKGDVYHFKCNGLNTTIYSVKAFYYDANGNVIIDKTLANYQNPQTGFTVTIDFDGASYFSLGFYNGNNSLSSYTPTDVMFCLNSVTDKTYEEYKETTIDTSFTEDYLYVNPSCYDYSENTLVNGVMRREEHKGIVGEVDLGTLDWFDDGNNVYYTGDLSDISMAQDWANFICSDYQTIYSSVGFASMPDKSAKRSANTARFNIKDTGISPSDISVDNKIAKLNGVMLYYEKATPSTPTLHDPIPNIPCEDGTTITAVTPQTDLVNAIDVPSTIAYMTKIGG